VFRLNLLIHENRKRTSLFPILTVTFRKRIYTALDQLQMDVDEWLEHYRRFWSESFDRLDEYLTELKKKEKKNARKQRKSER